MRFLCFFFFALTLLPVRAQEVVKWSGDYDVKNQRVLLNADIKEGWHLYSQHIDPMAGPIPTQFMFMANDLVELKGSVQEMEPIRKYDPNFEADVLFFEQQAIFVQDIQLQSNTTLTCIVTFMVCDDEKCLPPVDETIRINLTQVEKNEK